MIPASLETLWTADTMSAIFEADIHNALEKVAA